MEAVDNQLLRMNFTLKIIVQKSGPLRKLDTPL